MPEDIKNKEEKIIAEWSVHRSRREPRKLVIFILFLIAINALLYSFYREIYIDYPLFALLGNLILIGSISDFLFPVRYRLTAEGAEYRNFLTRKRISWQDVRNCYLTNEGIKLSPLEKNNRLENFRGFMLLFNNNNDEIINHVKRLASNRIK